MSSNEASARTGPGALDFSRANRSRRFFLIGATSAVGAAGVVGAAIPFVKSWVPSAKARAAGAPITVDISKLNEGEMLGPIPAWRGKPVFVLKRSPEVLQRLESETGNLADPESRRAEQQPEYAVNPWRARKPEIGVYLGLCTHLGCSPKYYGEVKPEPFDANWQGGFFCPCHGSKFDLAGRVQKNLPAPSNLEVPPYYFVSDNVILIGESGGAA